MDTPQDSIPTSFHQSQMQSMSDNASSPAYSIFTKGHSTQSSTSTTSSSSSPINCEFIEAARKKASLTQVREETPEQEGQIDAEMKSYCESGRLLDERPQLMSTQVDDSLVLPLRTSFDSYPYDHHDVLYDFDDSQRLAQSSGFRNSFKKHRSGDYSISATGHRFGSRIPSFAGRFKKRSAANPKLSINTENISSRSASATSSELISPALSAISKHESHLPSPKLSSFQEADWESSSLPIGIEKSLDETEEDQGQATTPLLPPIMMDLSLAKRADIQSPLQSPTIASTPILPSSTTPVTPQLPTLPSPPLSSRPSIASIKNRSRANTVMPPCEIPPLTIVDELGDEWSAQLGHANFAISPEPYMPFIDIPAYRQFRTDWDQARTNYAKHLARTGEHYGATSRIYILTEQKWASIDSQWKLHNEVVSPALGPSIARLSEHGADTSEGIVSDTLLEKPPTKVIVPQIDEACGKFPELGDEDIVGPMQVAPAKTPKLQSPRFSPVDPPRSRKRNFFKFLSDILNNKSNIASRQ